MQARFNQEKQRIHFDEYSANLEDSRYRKIHNLLRSYNKGSLLEIGCCGGEFLEVLIQEGWTVTGIEISEETAKKGHNKGIDILVHDANEVLPFKDNSFDVLIAGEVIEHTFDDFEFLKECKRVLTPEGVLILTTPNLISLKNRILMFFDLNPRFAVADFHYHVYTKSLLENLFRKTGFKEIKVHGNYILYSKCRERITGAIMENLGDTLPSLAEHLIVVAVK